jgi:hypothetical protein
MTLPAVTEVQLAAFAHTCACHADDEAFAASQDSDMRFAPESFIPSGTFDDGDVASAIALFTGHVVETEELTNGWTGERFRWARVRTLGGEVDVVADPEIVEGTPIAGGVIEGTFWLSGQLPAADTPQPARRSRWSRLRRR